MTEAERDLLLKVAYCVAAILQGEELHNIAAVEADIMKLAEQVYEEVK